MKDFKVGDKVKVLVKGSSVNPVGSVGEITSINSIHTCRVLVRGFSDDNLVNNHNFSDLELIKKPKFKVGDKVRLIANTTCSKNRIGDVGIISEDRHNDGTVFRVIVKGISDDDYGNNSKVTDLKLVLTKEQKIAKLLKKISKLNKK